MVHELAVAGLDDGALCSPSHMSSSVNQVRKRGKQIYTMISLKSDEFAFECIRKARFGERAAGKGWEGQGGVTDKVKRERGSHHGP